MQRLVFEVGGHLVRLSANISRCIVRTQYPYFGGGMPGLPASGPVVRFCLILLLEMSGAFGTRLRCRGRMRRRLHLRRPNFCVVMDELILAVSTSPLRPLGFCIGDGALDEVSSIAMFAVLRMVLTPKIICQAPDSSCGAQRAHTFHQSGQLHR